MTDSLLNEVDADVRAERIANLWMRYRMKLLVAIIAIIAATTAATLWQNYQEKRGGELLLRFTDAQALYNQGIRSGAADAFAAIAADTHGDMQTIAKIWQARALAELGKTPEAVAVLTPASAGSGLWPDVACLRLAGLDTKAAAPCLASKKDSPLINQRHEWQAATVWSEGDHAGAMAILEQLETSADTSEPTRARATEWLATMRAEKTGE